MIQYRHEHREKKDKPIGPRPGYPARDPKLFPMMKEYLDSRQLSPSLAAQNGWYPSQMDVPRVVIPADNSFGVVYWQARAMVESPKRYDSPHATREDSIILVWGVGPRQTPTLDFVTVSEGPMDALAAAEFCRLGIATMGNQPPQGAIEYAARVVKHMGFRALVIPDLDSVEFSSKIVSAFGVCGVETGVSVPPAKDLATLNRKERWEFLNG